MTEPDIEVVTPKLKSSSVISYTVGFVLSIALTLEAYSLATQHVLVGPRLVYSLAGLAFTQFVVQLVFFLHLAQEAKPRWNLILLLCAAGAIAVLVIGSVWVMYHLNYLMMPSDMNNYLMNEEGIH